MTESGARWTKKCKNWVRNPVDPFKSCSGLQEPNEGAMETAQNTPKHQIRSTRKIFLPLVAGQVGVELPLDSGRTAAGASVGVAFKEEKGKSVLG